MVPAYNVEGYVTRTLESLANQLLPVHEVIIVDDGSTDGTNAEISKFIRNQPKLRSVLITQRNSGVSAARNVGLDAATGEYILFLDADDVVDPALVSTLSTTFDATIPQPDLLTWRWRHIDPRNRKSEEEVDDTNPYWTRDIPAITTGPERLHLILKERSHWINMSSAAYRVGFIRENGLRFHNGCAAGEDLEFTWKALARASAIGWISESLSSYIRREGSITNSIRIERFDASDALLRTNKFIQQSDIPNRLELASEVRRLAFISFRENLRRMSYLMKPRDLLRAVETRHHGLILSLRITIAQRAFRSKRLAPMEIGFAISPTIITSYLKWRYTGR